MGSRARGYPRAAARPRDRNRRATAVGVRVMAAPHVPARDASVVNDRRRDASRQRPGPPVDDTLLTLEQARAALLGDAAAERSNAWPSIKTLRRAYSAGQLAVVQPVAGGRVMGWKPELDGELRAGRETFRRIDSARRWLRDFDEAREAGGWPGVREFVLAWRARDAEPVEELGEPTLAEFMEDWLRRDAVPNLAPNTIASYLPPYNNNIRVLPVDPRD